MKIIFGTTNKRKVDDLQNTINKMNLDIQVLSMADIGWDRGEIEENIFRCKDNDSQSFYWVNINEIEKYKIYPKSTYELITTNEIKHYIENNY